MCKISFHKRIRLNVDVRRIECGHCLVICESPSKVEIIRVMNISKVYRLNIMYGM